MFRKIIQSLFFKKYSSQDILNLESWSLVNDFLDKSIFNFGILEGDFQPVSIKPTSTVLILFINTEKILVIYRRRVLYVDRRRYPLEEGLPEGMKRKLTEMIEYLNKDDQFHFSDNLLGNTENYIGWFRFKLLSYFLSKQIKEGVKPTNNLKMSFLLYKKIPKFDTRNKNIKR